MIITILSNLLIVDEELLRTRPTGGYRKEEDMGKHGYSWDLRKIIKKVKINMILL